MKKEFFAQGQLLNQETIFFFIFVPVSFVTVFKLDVHPAWIALEAILAFLIARYLIAPKFYTRIVIVSNKIFKINDEQHRKASVKIVENKGKVISLLIEDVISQERG